MYGIDPSRAARFKDRQFVIEEVGVGKVMVSNEGTKKIRVHPRSSVSQSSYILSRVTTGPGRIERKICRSSSPTMRKIGKPAA